MSLVVGSVAGYFFARKNLEQQYDESVKREIAEAKRFYSTLYKKDEFKTPESAVEHLLPKNTMPEAARALLSYQGEDNEEMPEEDPNEEIVYERAKPFTEDELTPDEMTDEFEIVRNVFEEAKSRTSLGIDFDYEAEVRARTEEAPYVISQEEFMEGEPGYNQVSHTYFAGDGVLVDEKEQPINESDMTVGDDNLVRFGHRSNDNNIVYVRNDALELDFEILRSEGKYAEEVLGFFNTQLRPKARNLGGDDG